MIRDRLTDLTIRRTHQRIITPVIVQTLPGRLREVISQIRPMIAFEFLERERIFIRRFELPEIFLTRHRTFPRFNMFATLLPREAVWYLGNVYDVVRVYSDEPLHILQYPTVPPEGRFKIRTKAQPEYYFTSTFYTKKLIGADRANELGFSGEGVTCSVIDTGGTRWHEQTRHLVFDTTMPMQRTDLNGHGEWVASCIGGRFGKDERLSREAKANVICEGVVPHANLVGIKCLGWGVGTGMTSDIIDAIEMSIEKYRADVINMSLGTDTVPAEQEEDVHYEVFKECEKLNVIPVVANGNSGPAMRTVNSPAWLENCIAVGSVSPLTGKVSDFSSRGATPDGRIKPDCVSYGEDIDSAVVGLCDSGGDQTKNRYSPISGTSMATPHVSGLIAIMKQIYREVLRRDLSLAEIKRMMSELGEAKNNITGWGLFTFDMIEEWVETTYRTSLR